MGKGVGEVARLCCKLQVPCVAVAGAIADVEQVRPPFSAVYGLVPDLTTQQEAMRHARFWLETLARQVAGELRVGM
jgi:glycerate kinase